jgi:hypothetical protein
MANTTRLVRSVAVIGLFSAILACGGLGEPGTAFAVVPQNATVAPGGIVNISIIVANVDVVSYSYSVVGGNANGTVAPVFNDHARAVYTAPMNSGTYTVNASFVQFGGQVNSGTVTITVLQTP